MDDATEPCTLCEFHADNDPEEMVRGPCPPCGGTGRIPEWEGLPPIPGFPPGGKPWFDPWDGDR